MDKRMVQLAQTYGTPMYLFDGDAFLMRLADIKRAFGPAAICYCVKTNPFIVPIAQHSVNRMEVCSYGEFLLCRSHGIPMEQIFYTGVQKNEDEVRFAISCGVRTFSCESRSQLALLERTANSMDSVIDVFLRLGTNTQFGMDRQDIKEFLRHPHPDGLNFVGIHFFDRSQKRDASLVRHELEMLDGFCQELQRDCGFCVQQLEYGAGLDVDYFSADPASTDRLLLETTAPIIREFAERYRLTVEMGRFFAAPIGYYLTRVVDLKCVGGVHYAIVDGGSHQMHYDGQMMGMKLPPIRVLRCDDRQEQLYGAAEKWSICGSLCTHNDLITRQFSVSGLQIGDLICFSYIGAYSITEGMTTFLSRDIPPVILCHGEAEPVCLRKRMSTLPLNGAAL